MVNAFSLDLVDDLPDPIFAIPEPALVDENEEPEEEEEFKDEEEFEEEEPQEEEDDMELENVIEVKNVVEPEDKTIPASVYEVDSLFGWIASLSIRVCGQDTVHALVKKKGKAKDKYYGKLILDLGNEVRSSVEEGMAIIENLVKRLGNAEERNECKELKKDLEDPRGVVFEERLNEAIDVLVEDEESPSSEPRGSPLVNAVIPADRASRGSTRGNVGGYGGSSQGGAHTACKCTFVGFMKCNTTIFHGVEGAVELRRWFENTKSVFGISECTEGKKVKFAAAILQGPALTWGNTEGKVTSSRPANQSKVARMAHKLMEQKIQAKYERAMEGNKRKWENFQSGNSSRGNYKDNFRHQQNNQKQGNPIMIPSSSMVRSRARAVIVCGEKVVCIPYGNKTLIVEGDKGPSQLKKRLEDVPVIRDIPEVFPNDLPRLPPHRQVEFKIDLVPGAAPVARAPYRLAPSEMQELSVQLQELLEK
ncbi:hypothetical protein Tco_1174128 [Tanacetum coccineum]